MAEEEKKEDNKKTDEKKDDKPKEIPRTDLADKIVEVARSYCNQGITYELGSSGDGDTLDCGLFTQKVLSECEIDIGSRCADAQYCAIKNGLGKIYEADFSVPIAGDMVFYHHTYNCSTDEDCGVTHVGICTGNGMQIDCGSSAGVSERPIDTFTNYDPVFGRFDFLNIPLDPNLAKNVRGNKNRKGPKSSDKGLEKHPMGDLIHIIKIPKGKLFAEPIYPDFITVSDTVPQWVLDQVNAQSESVAKSVQDKAKHEAEVKAAAGAAQAAQMPATKDGSAAQATAQMDANGGGTPRDPSLDNTLGQERISGQ